MKIDITKALNLINIKNISIYATNSKREFRELKEIIIFSSYQKGEFKIPRTIIIVVKNDNDQLTAKEKLNYKEFLRDGYECYLLRPKFVQELNFDHKFNLEDFIKSLELLKHEEM